MQAHIAGPHQSDDGFAASQAYNPLNRRRTDSNPKDSNTDGFEQLPFAESVKILSEAMKAKVRQTHGIAAKATLADDGSQVHPKAGESLNHLLDSLSSALEKAGLETGNHSALQRILGDIRASVQYGPNTTASGQVAGMKKGPNPGLLNLSA